MDAASVSPYNLASPSTPTTQAACRISPVGSSKRKSKPVKRIVDVTVEEPVPSSNSPVMGTAAETARPEETEETDELREQVKEEQITNLEEAVKPAAMDQAEMLRKLTELLGGQFPMPTVTTPTLFPATFPLFTNTGCTLDLSAFQSNGDTNTTATNNNLVSLLGNVAFPALAINTSTPTTLSGVVPSASQITDRLRTPTLSSSSLVNSKGPVKRKLFESSSRDMMRGMGQGITKEERIDLDDLENFAQMFKKQRIKFGFTQGDVGVALGRRYGTDFSQTTISRFEALNLSFKNMCKLRPLLKEWLADAEAAIANGASLNDLLERPSGEKVVKNDSPTPLSDPNSFSGEMVKRRRKRTNLDVAQRTTLDAYFAMNPRPDHERMTEIANLLDLDRDVVRVWFCNRRQKMRRTDEPDQPEDALLTSLRAIAQGDSSSSEPQP